MQPACKKELPAYMRRAYARPNVGLGFVHVPFETALRKAWNDLELAQTRSRLHGHFGIVSLLDGVENDAGRGAVIKGPRQRGDISDFVREEMVMREMAGAAFKAPAYHSSNPDFFQFRMGVVEGEKISHARLQTLPPEKRLRAAEDIAKSMAGLAAHFENRDIAHIPPARREMAEVSPEKLAYAVKEGCVAKCMGAQKMDTHLAPFKPYFERLDAQAPVMIHGDAADYNILMTDEGEATLIDYAFARKHYPQRDILGLKPLGRDFCKTLMQQFNAHAGTDIRFGDIIAFSAARNILVAEEELADFYTPDEVAIGPVLDSLAKMLPAPVVQVSVPAGPFSAGLK